MATGAFENLFTLARQANTEHAQKDSRTVSITALEASAKQPRRFFDDQALTELAASIRGHGLLQPILVRPLPTDGTRYQIVAGERRFRAAQMAGLDKVPVVVRTLDDKAALEIGLAENLLREDLRPLEEAQTMRRLLDEFGYTYEALGAKLGKGKNYIWHRTNLLKLPEDLLGALDGSAGGAITTGHAESLAAVADPAWRQALTQRVLAADLSVAETRRRAKLLQILTEADVGNVHRQAMAAVVIADGMSETSLAARLQDRRPTPAVTGAPRQVDLKALASFDLYKQARTQPLIDIDEAITILQRDLTMLRRRRREPETDA
ncbi:MAG: ParB/RepB/Spo0J family partition protein [Candidatus Sericytochromatia bacterium]|nr:ParB/RepB/Spo0J family partition protein [Candidatus Sericytochromatia bacterium]